jgi:hypothetical protein
MKWSTRWSWRRYTRALGITITTHDVSATTAGVERFAWCLVTGLYVQGPEGEQ